MTSRHDDHRPDAPSNLGLRPLVEGSVPGVYKAPWALREAGLLAGLDAREAGVAVPPRYEAAWSTGDGDRNAPRSRHGASSIGASQVAA